MSGSYPFLAALIVVCVRHSQGYAPFEICRGALIDRGTGYNPYPEDCTQFLQCFRGADILYADIRNCPFGQFWDQNTLTCRPSKDISCFADFCRGKPDNVTYTYRGFSRAFWACSRGRSIAKCCPARYSYRTPGGCAPDATATKLCPPFVPFDITCNRKAADNDLRYYLEKIGSLDEYARRPCAPGSAFNSETCLCSYQTEDYMEPYTTCEPRIHFVFEMESLTPIGFTGTGTAAFDKVDITETGTALFSGVSSINIWSLSYVDYGKNLVIKFRFRPIIRGSLQALVCNSNSLDQLPSIFIGVDEKLNVIFKLITYSNKIASVSIPAHGGFNDVRLFYDGFYLRGSVNGVEETSSLSGNIQRRQTGIILGKAPGCINFEGELDDFIFYTCLPAKSPSAGSDSAVQMGYY